MQRKDGTSVYMTQDIGLAQNKYNEYKIDRSIYVIGDEQNYHMKVLQLICKKLGMPNADNIFHLSYGMVELPSGKMSSRKGNIITYYDLRDTMLLEAKKMAAERVVDEEQKDRIASSVTFGAIKFDMLLQDAYKRIVFDMEKVDRELYSNVVRGQIDRFGGKVRGEEGSESSDIYEDFVEREGGKVEVDDRGNVIIDV